ncbi:MAG: amidohydrolase family protein [Akkermansiaceae bacterium]|nr:amidohydrolase family protein [Akkermansiaceae bacterium]
MIDSHHHFWKYKPADFPWVTEDMSVLQQDYRIDELEHELEFSGIDQVISVQSRRSDRENHFLLEQAKKSDNLVAGIVGWAPLDRDEIRVFLDQYLHEPMLKGVREIITGSPEEKFLNNPDFDQGMAELIRHNLAFDLLVSEQQLPAAIAFADRHPNQRMVLNHCGCPQIDAQPSSASWAHSIRELARRPHVYCKISGMSSQLPADTGRAIHGQILRPYFDTVCNAFGPERMMYGSDWPICELTTTYPAWLNTIDDLIYSLSESEKHAIHQDTAIRFYQL